MPSSSPGLWRQLNGGGPIGSEFLTFAVAMVVARLPAANAPPVTGIR